MRRLWVWALTLVLGGCGGRAITAARVYLEQGNLRSAEAQLEEALRQDPEDPEAYYWLGEVYGRMGRWEDMVGALRKAEEVDTRGWGRRAGELRRRYWIQVNNLGVDRARRGDMGGAEEAFRDAITIDSTIVDAYKNLGFCRYRSGDIDGAIRAYERASSVAPEDVDVWARLGLLRLRKGDYERAVEEIRRGVRLRPSDPKLWAFLASACGRAGMIEEAIEAYKRASELDPNDPDVWYNLGVLYGQNGKYDKAARCYEEVLKLSPQDEEARMSLAELYVYRLDRWDDALSLLRDIVKDEPENGEAWEMLSIVYVRKGMEDKARDAYLRAKKLRGK